MDRIEYLRSTRYNVKKYRKFYFVYLVLRFENIFKVSLEESIKRISNLIDNGNLRTFINKCNEFFEINIDYEDIKKSHKYIKKHRNFKIFNNKEYIRNHLSEKYHSKSTQEKEEINQKIKNTFKERYNVENYTQTSEYKEKRNKTCLKKYNKNTFMGSKEFVQKSKNTSLERYGAEIYTQSHEYREQKSEIHKKYQDTCLKNYGVDNYSKTLEFKEKSKNTCLENYGVDNYFKSLEFKNKDISITQEEYNRRMNEEFNEDFIRENFIVDGYFLKQEFMDYFFISDSHVSKVKKCFNIKEKNRDTIERTFLEHYSKEYNLELEYQFYIKEIKVRCDGYCASTNTIIEFLGDYFHGNPLTKNEEEINVFNKKSMKQLYIETFKRFDEIVKLGFKIIYIWESDYKKYGLKGIKEYN